VPDDWHVRRVVGRVRIDGPMPLLDARAFATCTVLRADLASTLVRLKLPDLDPSTVRGPYRELTQEIAGWAYDRGHQGIVYRSRFDDGLSVPLDCLALFGVDGIAQVRPVGVDPIRRDDPDLLLAATQHRLALRRSGFAFLSGPRPLPKPRVGHAALKLGFTQRRQSH
jgi:hypothetical protein